MAQGLNLNLNLNIEIEFELEGPDVDIAQLVSLQIRFLYYLKITEATEGISSPNCNTAQPRVLDSFRLKIFPMALLNIFSLFLPILLTFTLHFHDIKRDPQPPAVERLGRVDMLP